MQKFPTFIRTWRFVTVSSREPTWCCPQAVESTLRSVPALSSYQRMRCPTNLYLSSFRSKIVYTFLVSPRVSHTPPVSSISWQTNDIWWIVKITKFLIIQFRSACTDINTRYSLMRHINLKRIAMCEVVSTPVPYSEGSGLKSLPGHLLH
jgi:hypothetical protein